MHSKGKHSARILGLVNDGSSSGKSDFGMKRQVLSPKKITSNLPKKVAQGGKRGLRLELDQMLQMAKTNKPGAKPRANLIPDFGFLGKRSVVQFDLISKQSGFNNENVNHWAKDTVTIDSESVNSPQ
jgi:hypothetical protein